MEENKAAVDAPAVEDHSQDVILESCSPAILEQLRAADQMAARLRHESQLLVNGYVAAKGWNMATHAVDIDIASGMITVSPRPQTALA